MTVNNFTGAIPTGNWSITTTDSTTSGFVYSSDSYYRYGWDPAVGTLPPPVDEVAAPQTDRQWLDERVNEICAAAA